MGITTTYYFIILLLFWFIKNIELIFLFNLKKKKHGLVFHKLLPKRSELSDVECNSSEILWQTHSGRKLKDDSG
jgi:hypothetical protein